MKIRRKTTWNIEVYHIVIGLHLYIYHKLTRWNFHEKCIFHLSPEKYQTIAKELSLCKKKSDLLTSISSRYKFVRLNNPSLKYQRFTMLHKDRDYKIWVCVKNRFLRRFKQSNLRLIQNKKIIDHISSNYDVIWDVRWEYRPIALIFVSKSDIIWWIYMILTFLVLTWVVNLSAQKVNIIFNY